MAGLVHEGFFRTDEDKVAVLVNCLDDARAEWCELRYDSVENLSKEQVVSELNRLWPLALKEFERRLVEAAIGVAPDADNLAGPTSDLSA